MHKALGKKEEKRGENTGPGEMEEKEQERERKENGEKAARARRPCTDIQMLLLLYIWCEHNNVITLD